MALQIAQDAAFLRADKRFSPPDALVVATGLATQVRHLVTNDHDWSTKLASMSTRIVNACDSSSARLPRNGAPSTTTAIVPMGNLQEAALAGDCARDRHAHR